MTRFLNPILLASTAICLLAWGGYYSSFDLWGDELVSLKDYALVDFVTTATTYPNPNNHILANLVNNAVADLFRVETLTEALDHVPLFRWVQWIAALGTCLYVLYAGSLFFSRPTGALSAVFLVTCLPFLNFGMQLRGYGLSMFFGAALLYHTWASSQRNRVADLALVSAFTFGMLYSIPSNVYFLLALGAVVFWEGLFPAGQPEKASRILDRKASVVLLGMGVGLAIALLCYLPVLDDVLHNRFTEASPENRTFVLVDILPKVASGLVSFRYLLVPVSMVGFFVTLRKKERALRGSEKGVSILLLLILPFLFSYLRDDFPFQRTFIFLAPVFSLALGAGTVWCLEHFVSAAGRRAVFILLATAYAIGSLGFGYHNVQERLREAIRSGVREQNLLANYYQSRRFQPSRAASRLAPIHEARPGPILLVDELDPVSMSFYLLAQGLESTAILSVRPAGPRERGTHVGQFQRSRSEGDSLTFFNSTLHLLDPLADGNLLTPALVVGENQAPSEVYYVLTAFPEKNRRLFQSLYPNLGLEVVVDLEGFKCFRITVG
jgi:hypothetical protein